MKIIDPKKSNLLCQQIIIDGKLLTLALVESINNQLIISRFNKETASTKYISGKTILLKRPQTLCEDLFSMPLHQFLYNMNVSSTPEFLINPGEKIIINPPFTLIALETTI